MAHANLNRMFNPRGIAIVGANTDLTKPGRQALHALVRHKYKGGIYPVNPKYQEIDGTICYKSLSDIDGPVDVAVIALPAQHVPDVIAQCGLKRIPFAVVFGGGFRETGDDGAALELKLMEAAKNADVRIIGPNCLGYKNIHDGVFACFGSISRKPDLRKGQVSAVIQSGGYGNSMVIQCDYAGIGFRYLVASGGEVDIKATDLIEAYVDDPGTKVILAYLEGVHDGRAFMAAARRAQNAGKPLVVVKAGNTDQGKRAAASHTAFMTASYDVYRAAFKQCGVIEARDIGDAVDILQSLVAGRLANGRRVAVMSGSGGSLVSFSDAADDYGLTLQQLTVETQNILRQNIPSIGSVKNPVDMTAGFQKQENAKKYQNCIEAVLDDPGVDQLGLFLATAGGEDLARAARIIVNARNSNNKPIYIFSSLPPDLTAEGREIFRQSGVPLMGTPRRVAAAMAKVADYSSFKRDVERLIPAINESSEQPYPLLPKGALTLHENLSKELLNNFGISVTKDVLIKKNDQALPANLKFPLVVKIVSAEIPHKSDIGGVIVDVRDVHQLRSAIEVVKNNAMKVLSSPSQISGVLLSEMVTDGVEVIIGALNDSIFGPVVILGMGGIFAETLRDTTYRIAPFNFETAIDMINEMKASPILSGLRGQKPRDVQALAKTLVRVSELTWLIRDRFVEMDINPVFVRPQGSGVVAADALIVVRQ